MEKLVKLFMGLFLASSLLMSCNKDDEDNDVSPKNHLKIGETEYVLSKGTCENYGQMEDDAWQYDGYNLDLTLFSSDFTISTDSYGKLDASGSGQLIYFEMFSSKRNEFDSRDYTFSSSEPYSVGTFDYSNFSINYSVNNDDAELTEITSGKVTISKSGSEYSITINCISENGESVTGFFKGSLQYFDYTVDTKSARMVSTKISKRRK